MAGARTAGSDAAHIASTALQWIMAGHRLALATVIKTWGSAPRRVGAHLVIREDGAFAGSISGGCVEGDVIANALDLLTGVPLDGGPTFRLLSYDITNQDAWNVGLACGGQIAIFVQLIRDAAFPPALLTRMADMSRQRTPLCLSTCLTDGQSRESPATSPPDDDTSDTDTHLTIVYTPAPRLDIVGAVHIAQHLTRFAKQLGYEMRVIDPRASFATPERFPDTSLDLSWPDESLQRQPLDMASALVTLTHEPRIDDAALQVALHSDAFYIAALGSRRTHEKRCTRLAAQGFTPDQIARIHAPAGLDIAAENPAEIALAIAAQMVEAGHGRAA